MAGRDRGWKGRWRNTPGVGREHGLFGQGRGTAAQLSPPAERIEDSPFTGTLTQRMACEIIGHEAIVREAQESSRGIWTRDIGVTSASGHDVEHYRDNPQMIERCIEICL